MNAATALIAEDEPLLAHALAAALGEAWPELQVLPPVGDGRSAVQATLACAPDVLFFDIRMPGLGGLDAAAELADAWAGTGKPFPALVFVTAYEQYAVRAFDAQAVDYVLKPVQPARLARTVQRVQAALAARALQAGTAVPDAVLAQLRALLMQPACASAEPLRIIQAGLPGGAGVRMVPIDEVLAFDAADKYVRVLTAGDDYWLRTPLRELQQRLDPQVFWQVHRGTLVRAAAIATVDRDAAGRLHLALRGRHDRLPVSRVHAGLFRAM